MVFLGMENNINHKPDYQDRKPQNLSTSPQIIVGSLFSAAQIFIWIHPTGVLVRKIHGFSHWSTPSFWIKTMSTIGFHMFPVEKNQHLEANPPNYLGGKEHSMILWMGQWNPAPVDGEIPLFIVFQPSKMVISEASTQKVVPKIPTQHFRKTTRLLQEDHAFAPELAGQQDEYLTFGLLEIMAASWYWMWCRFTGRWVDG